MGAWGGKLYQDDYALDLKATISVLSKLSISGDELLELIIDDTGECPDISEEDGSTFWLVVADQFEKKGIRGTEVFEKAIEIIENGIDIQIQIDRDMDSRSVDARKKEISNLYNRLKDPKPEITKTKKRKPPLLVEPGEIYYFPTMNTTCFNPYFKSWEEDEFNPTGWGALIVFKASRLYDHFPWLCYSPLNVNQDTEPTFESAVDSRLIGMGIGCKYEYFSIGIPKLNHFKKIPLKILGKVDLNNAKCSELINPYSTHEHIKWAVHNDLSVCKHAYNLPRPGEHRTGLNPLELGLKVRDFTNVV